MARSLWKGPFVDNFLLKKSSKLMNMSQEKQQESVSLLGARSPTPVNVALPSIQFSKEQKIQRNIKPLAGPIRVWSRRSFILPEFIDKFFEVHNGKQFISFQVNEDMVGHKFGEFASTRKKTLHKKKVKSKG